MLKLIKLTWAEWEGARTVYWTGPCYIRIVFGSCLLLLLGWAALTIRLTPSCYCWAGLQPQWDSQSVTSRPASETETILTSTSGRNNWEQELCQFYCFKHKMHSLWLGKVSCHQWIFYEGRIISNEKTLPFFKTSQMVEFQSLKLACVYFICVLEMVDILKFHCLALRSPSIKTYLKSDFGFIWKIRFGFK